MFVFIRDYIHTIQLQVDELQPPDARHVHQQVLHLLEDHPAGPVDVDLVVLAGKVAGELVAEGLDVGEAAVELAKLKKKDIG